MKMVKRLGHVIWIVAAMFAIGGLVGGLFIDPEGFGAMLGTIMFAPIGYILAGLPSQDGFWQS